MTFRNYLLAQALGVAAFNTAVNAGYAWFLWGGREHLSTGTASHLPLDMIGTDLAMTPIWIGLLSVLLGTPFIRKAFADGTVLRATGVRPHRALRRLPRSIPVRAVVVAILCALALAIPLSLLLPAFGDGTLSSSGAVGTKIIITVVSSLVIVPFVVYSAARDAVPGG